MSTRACSGAKTGGSFPSFSAKQFAESRRAALCHACHGLFWQVGYSKCAAAFALIE
jgi:hypothetical protein